MENQELFKQAILDAKAVRETAMAAARTTLAEHFEPFIRETMEKTLEEDDTMEEATEMEEAMMHDKDKMHKEATEMEESTLDEILAELDALSEEKIEEEADLEEDAHVKSDGYDGKPAKGETGYPDKAKATHGDGKLHEAEDDKKEEEDEEAEEAGEDLTKDIEAGEGGDEQEVVDITVGELKDIIRDVFMQLQGGGMAPEAPLDGGTELAADLDGDEMEAGEEEEISLDEILAELEREEEGVKEGMKKDHKVEEGTGPGGDIDPEAGDVHKVQYDETKKELKEAVKTIKALKTELNEINLFSAKLLYVNKIFKAKNLSESQKTKVINAFDRATSVKEVENTYKTLLESVSAETKKSSLKESVGFASKPIGHAPARPIVEADAFVSRWQTLAGIK